MLRVICNRACSSPDKINDVIFSFASASLCIRYYYVLLNYYNQLISSAYVFNLNKHADFLVRIHTLYQLWCAMTKYVLFQIHKNVSDHESFLST